MPRQLRIEYRGAIYHVMNRGDHREPIFKDDDDRQKFLLTLGQVCEKTGWEIHAYCLMPDCPFRPVSLSFRAGLVTGCPYGVLKLETSEQIGIFGHAKCPWQYAKPGHDGRSQGAEDVN